MQNVKIITEIPFIKPPRFPVEHDGKTYVFTEEPGEGFNDKDIYLVVVWHTVEEKSFEDMCQTLESTRFKGHVVIWTWECDHLNYDHFLSRPYVKIIRSRGKGEDMGDFFALYLEAFFPPGSKFPLMTSKGCYSREGLGDQPLVRSSGGSTFSNLFKRGVTNLAWFVGVGLLVKMFKR